MSATGLSAATTASTQAAVIRCPHWQAFAPPVRLVTADERKSRTPFEKTQAGRILPAKKRITSGPVASKAGRAAGSQPAGSKIGPGQGAKVAALHDKARSAGQRGVAKAHCPTHRVRAGETLFSIAAARLGNGKHWTRIRDANGNLDPARLKPGMQLTMPCTTTVPRGDPTLTVRRGNPTLVAGAAGAKAGTVTASQNAVKTNPRASSVKAKANAVVAAPKPPPVWTAKKGETFRAVIERWAKRAGHTVIIDTSDAWTIHVAVELQGDFKTAIGHLVRGLSHDGVAPPVRIYPNKVVRVGL